MKGIYVNQISEGLVRGIFFLETKRVLETKNAKPYIFLVLSDKTGSIIGKVWDNVEEINKTIQEEDFVAIDSYAEKYNSNLQLVIKNIQKIDNSLIKVEDFMPVSPIEIESLKSKLFFYISSINSNTFYHKLCYEIFSDKQILESFTKCPASIKGHHHSYIGGLLEHSVSICDNISRIIENYPYLDYDLLIAGALLHDIGKIRAYDYSKYPFKSTNEGRLLGHTVIGTHIINEYAKKVSNDNNNELNLLLHMILSHHGTKEMNAVVLPMFEEAFLLHLMDYLDATFSYIRKLKLNLKGNERLWTDFQKGFDRYFFLLPSREYNFLKKEDDY